jgi:hypothetical protein
VRPLSFLTEMSTKNLSGIKHGRRISLTILLPSVDLFCRQCLILDVSKLHRLPRPVTDNFTFLFISSVYHQAETQYINARRAAIKKYVNWCYEVLNPLLVVCSIGDVK